MGTLICAICGKKTIELNDIEISPGTIKTGQESFFFLSSTGNQHHLP
jgi:hypothetical protein